MTDSSPQTGTTRYSHYSIAYHFVWIPKYRRRIFDRGEVEAACKELIAEACLRNQIRLIEIETDRDHVHVFVSAPPRLSPSQIANILKGFSSRYLRLRFPHLLRLCGREQLWTQAYYVGTAGSVSAEVIRRYISQCQGK